MRSILPRDNFLRKLSLFPEVREPSLSEPLSDFARRRREILRGFHVKHRVSLLNLHENFE